jgi:UDP-N-acetylglucosamine 2-epimerase (non-hydrolysing)
VCEILVGTRPEAIKLAPVIKVLRDDPATFALRVVTSGQHGEICRTALGAFGLTFDGALSTEPLGFSLAASAGELVRAVGRELARRRPDVLLVQGDTTTSMAAALAGFYAKVPVAHVEAGLRSGDLANPFPEEANRKIIDVLSTILLPPTMEAHANLAAAGFHVDMCPITGNTVVDALQLLCAAHRPVLDGTGISEADLEGRRLLLVTTHRRESWGADLEEICGAIRTIADQHSDVLVSLPVHPNPNVKAPVTNLLGDHPRIKLLPPLDYIPFLACMRRAYLILTDSGGIQEEAPSLGIPVLVLRKTTERPEAIRAGLARLIGTGSTDIVKHVEELIGDQEAYRRMATAINPFGDGRASKRIAEVLRNWRAGRVLLPRSRWFMARPGPKAADAGKDVRAAERDGDAGIGYANAISPLVTDSAPEHRARRWTANRKAAVVRAVASGELGFSEACERYALSPDQLACWQQLLLVQGLAGVRSSRRFRHAAN